MKCACAYTSTYIYPKWYLKLVEDNVFVLRLTDKTIEQLEQEKGLPKQRNNVGDHGEVSLGP